MEQQVFQTPKFIQGMNVDESVILENIKANTPRAKEFKGVTIRKAVVCGGGPSLADNLEEIKEKKARGFHIWALNGAIHYLEANGIKVDGHFMFDARYENVDFVRPFYKHTVYFAASQCHPAIFDVLADHDKVHMFHILNGDHLLEYFREHFPGSSILTSHSTAGLAVLNLLTVLGYMVAHCYGYDSSFREGDHHAYEQSLNDDQKVLDFRFQNRVYKSSGPMASQAQQFIQFYKRYRTMQIELFGEGLLPDMWRFHEFVAKNGSLENAERVKYEKMWTLDAYRKESPGERYVDEALKKLNPEKGSTFYDFGCGPGRATAEIIRAGFGASGIDIASNALDDDVTVPFIQCNLWDLPLGMSSDYGYCTDVMEHIPREKVDATLACIARVVRKSIFFSINFWEDGWGDRIGERLHLTIEQEGWWKRKLLEYWDDVKVVGITQFVCSNPRPQPIQEEQK